MKNPKIKIANRERWLYEPENKDILDNLKKAVQQKGTISFKDWLHKQLKDPQLALAYLNEAFKDKDDQIFLIAVEDILNSISFT